MYTVEVAKGPLDVAVVYLSRYTRPMNAGALIREARIARGLTQAQLAATARTSQAAVSAYESGARVPSLDTLVRLLAAAGARLTVAPAEPEVRTPSRAELARAGRALAEVIELAEALPVRHAPELRYPRLAAAR